MFNNFENLIKLDDFQNLINCKSYQLLDKSIIKIFFLKKIQLIVFFITVLSKNYYETHFVFFITFNINFIINIFKICGNYVSFEFYILFYNILTLVY